MLNDLYNLLARLVSWKSIALLALLSIPFNAVLFPIRATQFSRWSGDPTPVLDATLYYSPERVFTLFDSLGPEGRRLYLYTELTVDLVFPLVYGLLGSLVLIFLLQKTLRPASQAQKLALLPLAMMLADYGENISLSVLLLRHPEHWEVTAQIAALLTMTKWGLGFLGVTLAFLALGYILWKRLRPLKP